MGRSKIVYAGETLIDLTADTVTADSLLKGYTAHDKAGNLVNGNATAGGGDTKNVQACSEYASIRTTSYSTTGIKLTVGKTGTYKVSWMGWRSSNGGTNGSQLYINNSAYGSAQTTFTNTYGQAVSLTGVNLTQGQEIEVRARARSTSYYMAVGNLIIEEQ